MSNARSLGNVSNVRRSVGSNLRIEPLFGKKFISNITRQYEKIGKKSVFS
jgi:hypothetical protein